MSADSYMADELNTFHVCFEADHASISLPTSATERNISVSDDRTNTISEDEVRRAMKHVNIRKAASPESISGRVPVLIN